MKNIILMISLCVGVATMSNAGQFIFKSADGGLINLEEFKGKPDQEPWVPD